MNTLLSATQAKCLELFQQAKFQDLILIFRNSSGSFPQKQYPVVQFTNWGSPGTFGCRTSNTTFAIPECDRYITFTIGILGRMTLNLHAPSTDSVEWVNGTASVQWVYKHQIGKKEADQLAAWAETVTV